MPAPTLAELRAELAENLSAITGVQVSAYMMANPTPPSIEVVPDEVNYDQTMQRGMDHWRFIVRAYASAANDQAGQMLLDLMLAPSGGSSVKAALEADRTLDGKAQTLRVVQATGYRIYGRAGGPEYLGCEWTVDVYAAGV